MIPAGDLPARPRRDGWSEVFEANGYTPALDERDRQLAAVTAERDALAVWFDVTLDYLTAMLDDLDVQCPGCGLQDDFCVCPQTSPTGGDVR